MEPTITINKLTPVSSMNAPFSEMFLAGKSKVKISASCKSEDGTEIESVYARVYVPGFYQTVYEEDDWTSDYISAYGEGFVEVVAKDSEGRYGAVSAEITVIPYEKPKVTCNCYRCDENGNKKNSGAYLKIIAERRYSKVMTGETQNNFCTIQFQYKENGTAAYSGWNTILEKDSTSDKVTTEPLLDGVLDPQKSYVVQVGVTDDVGETQTTTLLLGSDKVYIHRTKNSMGLGKYVDEEELFDCAWNARFRKELQLGEDGFPLKAYVIETGTFELTEDNSDVVHDPEEGAAWYWHYQKWSDGTLMMYGKVAVMPTENNPVGTLFLSNTIHLKAPFPLDANVVTVNGTASSDVVDFCVVTECGYSIVSDSIFFRLMSPVEFDLGAEVTSGNFVFVNLMVCGKFE